jgi:hypothetical protein
VLHQQATTELEQGLTVALGQLIEDGPPGGIGKGFEDVQDDSIGKWLLACQVRGDTCIARRAALIWLCHPAAITATLAHEVSDGRER